MLVVSFFFFAFSVAFCSCLFFFFFSSRRRHTRLVSDWSSDVCSSDLGAPARAAGGCCECDRRCRSARRGGPSAGSAGGTRGLRSCGELPARRQRPGGGRSEERRVGTECRCRGRPHQESSKRSERAEA